MMLWMLSACNSIPVKNFPSVPPAALYSASAETWPEPITRGADNGALVRYAQGLKSRLEAAYADRSALRVWASTVRAPASGAEGVAKGNP